MRSCHLRSILFAKTRFRKSLATRKHPRLAAIPDPTALRATAGSPRSPQLEWSSGWSRRPRDEDCVLFPEPLRQPASHSSCRQPVFARILDFRFLALTAGMPAFIFASLRDPAEAASREAYQYRSGCWTFPLGLAPAQKNSSSPPVPDPVTRLRLQKSRTLSFWHTPLRASDLSEFQNNHISAGAERS